MIADQWCCLQLSYSEATTSNDIPLHSEIWILYAAVIMRTNCCPSLHWPGHPTLKLVTLRAAPQELLAVRELLVCHHDPLVSNYCCRSKTRRHDSTYTDSYPIAGAGLCWFRRMGQQEGVQHTRWSTCISSSMSHVFRFFFLFLHKMNGQLC